MGGKHREDQTERYEIRRRIGSGGVGVVYEAFDTRLERLVAVKRLLPPEESEDLGGIGRDLKREAAALASLQHPNIVTVLDVGSDDDGVFVVMELLVGETIDLTVGRGALTVPDFGRFAEQVLDALAAAHGCHLLHRDLKPSNVFVIWPARNRFHVKLLDFGLAKFAPRPALQTVDHRQSILGSVFFMAPEQFERKPLDARTDLYQLGCLFFHVLTNRHAFEGETTAAVMDAHLGGAPRDLARLRPDVSDPLRRWVLWHLNRSPDDRPESAEASLAALREIAEGGPLPAMAQPSAPVAGGRGESPTATVPVKPRTATLPKSASATSGDARERRATEPVRPVARPQAPVPVLRAAAPPAGAAPPPIARGGAGGGTSGETPRSRTAAGGAASPSPSGKRRRVVAWIAGTGAVIAVAAAVAVIGIPDGEEAAGGRGGAPGAAAPSFPADLEHRLAAWFDAGAGVFRDAGVTPAEEGEAVAHWEDRSPSYGRSPAQYHITEAADPVARQPLWWRDAMLDPPRPVLVFDGSKNLVIGRPGAGHPIDPAFADGRFSVFAACRPGDGAGRQDLFGAGNTGNRSSSFSAFARDGAWHLAVESDGRPAERTASVEAAAQDEWLQVVEFRIGDHADGLVVSRWRASGEEVLGESTLPMPEPPPPPPNEMRLGSRFPGGTGAGEWFRGVLAELLVFDRPLTEDERRRVAAYLVARHRLGGG